MKFVADIHLLYFSSLDYSRTYVNQSLSLVYDNMPAKQMAKYLQL